MNSTTNFVRLLLGAVVFSLSQLTAQPNFTANDVIPPYNGGFHAGVNPGAHPPFTDEKLADLAAGNRELGIEGCGVKTLRPSLIESFLEQWGYAARVEAFQHYAQLGMSDHTVIAGFPGPQHRDPAFYCPDHQSELFANMYEPIWDGGANGTPVNDANHAALYFWKAANTYKQHIKFWEIWNEPGFDYTSLHGYLLPGQPGNWWDADPDPCDYKLRAPIQHYVRLLRIAYEVIKTADPTAYVLCGGVGYPSFLDAILRNTDNPAGGALTPDFPLRGGAYFDAIGYHSYPHFDSSTRTFNDSTQAFDYFRHSDGAAEGISVVKNRFVPVLKKYGYDGLTHPEKLWLVTEINVPRRAYPQFGMGGDDLQRNFMLKAYVQCLRENFAAMHVYALEEAQDFEKMTFEFDAMGLYKHLNSNDGIWQTRNDAGIALKTASEILVNATFDPAQTAALNLPDNIGGGAFWNPQSRRHTLVLWAKTQIDQSETASASFNLPGSAWEKWVRRDWDFGATRTASTLSGGTTLQLDATPVFFAQQNFTATAWTGCAPLTVTFTGINDFQSNEWPQWEFENGNPASADGVGTVSVVFQTPGEHKVKFKTVHWNTGTLLREETWSIRVEAAPQAAFDGDPAGGWVHFQNLSTQNADSFSWDFGDGGMSGEANPSHVFYEDGNFQVSLTVTNQCGSNTFSTTYAIDAPTTSEVGYSAADTVVPFNRPFRPGAILRFANGWTDEQLADIAAGSALQGQEGAGVRAGRFVLPQYFLDFWGYDIRQSTFQHYANLDLRDNVAVLGFPNPQAQEEFRFCETDKSVIFKNIYTDIWDGGANGTPINEANPFALYVWKTVLSYRDFVEFWQVYDAPDYDISGKRGWLPSGEPGNWWDFDPDPCDLSLRAPIETYVRMLRIAYEIVKTLDPDAYVLLGGIGYPSFLDALMRNTDNPDGGLVHPRYPLGGGAYFDAIGFNAYPFVDESTSSYNPDLGGFEYRRHSDAAARGIFLSRSKFEAVLARFGYNGGQHPAKKWLVTEANTPRKKFGAYFGGEEAQRNYLVKAMVEAMAGNFVLFNVNNLSEQKPAAQAAGPDDAMGLYEFLGNKMPYQQTLTDGGVAFKTASSLLYTAKYDPVRTALLALPDSVMGFAFRDLNNKFIYALWAKTTTDNSEAAHATYSFPTALAINSLFLKNWDWSRSKQQSDIAPQGIALTGSPVFLTENENPPAPPLAAFDADVKIGCPGTWVQFSDFSTHALSRQWHFPGGVPAMSDEADPLVFYPEAGTFGVSLTATNAVGSHTATQSDFVKILEKPKAEFSATVDAQQAQIVRFQNLATDIDSLKWLMHDGTVIFSWQFDRFYFDNGEFPVTLVVFGPCGSDTLTQTVRIQATPIANFGVILPQECGQLYAALQNYSGSSPTSVEWFVPGAMPSYSTDNSVFVTFPGPGTFTATLVVANAFGADTLSKTFSLAANAVYEQLMPEICANDTFSLAGQIFTASNPTGEIVFPGAATQGCDSIVTVELRLIPTSSTTVFDSIPVGTSLDFCGETLSQSGTYTCHLQGQEGCDSLVTLHLELVVAETEPSFFDKCAVAPNPFSERLTLEWEQAERDFLSLELCAPTGQVLRHLIDNQSFGNGSHRLEFGLSDLPAGVFSLVFRGERGVRAFRVVKI